MLPIGRMVALALPFEGRVAEGRVRSVAKGEPHPQPLSYEERGARNVRLRVVLAIARHQVFVVQFALGDDAHLAQPLDDEAVPLIQRFGAGVLGEDG